MRMYRRINEINDCSLLQNNLDNIYTWASFNNMVPVANLKGILRARENCIYDLETGVHISACRNFRKGGGAKKKPPHKDKKGPPYRKKVPIRPPHRKKGPHKEKNSEKTPD